MVNILPDDAPAPRLCHLIKWPDFDGYGFNLHAERSNPGQFIGKIDDQSPAQLAGLREGDRIIEVNGVNISNENHRQVVERIKSNPLETKLLVVDAEADLWYREQDLVVKSSQINVVYIKTPVPRPEPDSPRANFHNSSQQQQSQTSNQPQQQANQPQENGDSKSSSSDHQKQQDQEQKAADTTSDHQDHSSLNQNQSLETSDFNEDSLEQQVKQQQQQQVEEVRPSRVSPPMSPDSGRGDEDHHLLAGSDKTLTVEAEINHRQPQIEDDHEPQQANEEQAPSNNNISKLETQTTESLIDEKEHIRKLHNKSADSGKSSSPDATSSSSNASGSHNDLVEVGAVVDEAAEVVDDVPSDVSEQRPTSCESDIVPSVNSNGLMLGDNNKKELLRSEAKQSPEPPTSKLNDVATVTKQAPVTEQKHHRTEDTQVNIINNNNNNNDTDPEDSRSEKGLQGSAMTKILTSGQPQKQTLEGNVNNNNNNNNYSGLNLNMTASQMRELIASRKKFDPKKAQMNIRQKYEIIQQM